MRIWYNPSLRFLSIHQTAKEKGRDRKVRNNMKKSVFGAVASVVCALFCAGETAFATCAEARVEDGKGGWFALSSGGARRMMLQDNREWKTDVFTLRIQAGDAKLKAGERRGEVVSVFKDGALRFTADTARDPSDATFLYEIVR